jgi:hypothetical protein
MYIYNTHYDKYLKNVKNEYELYDSIMSIIKYAKKMRDNIMWTETYLPTAMERFNSEDNIDCQLLKVYMNDPFEEYVSKLQTWMPYQPYTWVLLDNGKIIMLTKSAPDPTLNYKKMWRTVAEHYYYQHIKVPDNEFIGD